VGGDVGDEALVAIDPSLEEHLGEFLPRSADERRSAALLLDTRGFPHYHYAGVSGTGKDGFHVGVALRVEGVNLERA
jgi:hypothetical protein